SAQQSSSWSSSWPSPSGSRAWRSPGTNNRLPRLLADPRAGVPREGLRRAPVLGIPSLLSGLLHARRARFGGLARAEPLGMDGVHLVALAAVLDGAVARVLDVVARAGRELRRAAVVAADRHEGLVGGGQVLAARALDEHAGEHRDRDDAGERRPREETRAHAAVIGHAPPRQRRR